MPEKLRGFRDFYPEDQEIRREIFETMMEECRRFGFREVDGPSIESVDLYAHKSGEEIMGQMFNFIDKGGREVTLVPEFTPTLARMVASRKDLIKPLKWYTLAKFWRYEEPQSGRFREFYQLNADILGSDSLHADVEVLNLASSIMKGLGLGNKVKLKISSRTLLDDIIKYLNIGKKDSLYYLLDRWIKISDKEKDSLISEIGISKENLELIVTGKIIEELKSPNLDRLIKIMDEFNEYSTIKIELDLKIVRGLAYYTSTVFEIWDLDEKMRAIMGGGRYDNIISQMNGDYTPAVGFGMGDAVLENLLKREGLWYEKEKKRVFISIADDKGRKYSYYVSKKLRESGIMVDLNVTERNLGKQIEYAAKMGFKYSIILGEREFTNKIISIRDLITGEQFSINLEDAIIKLKNS
jgi:histidyl-tRNA synthetase